MERKPLFGENGEQPDIPRGQIFLFGAFVFNVDRALATLAEAPREARPINVADWARFFGFDLSQDDGIALFAPRHLDPDYAMTTDLGEPVIIATLRGDEGREYPLLIDGTHRIYKAYTLGEETLPAYVLDDEESLTIRDDPFVSSQVHWPSYDQLRTPEADAHDAKDPQ
jgi:hypothetical protein